MRAFTIVCVWMARCVSCVCSLFQIVSRIVWSVFGFDLVHIVRAVLMSLFVVVSSV